MAWLNLRRLFFCFACFVTLIAVFYAEEKLAGQTRLEKFKGEQEAKGERLDFASLSATRAGRSEFRRWRRFGLRKSVLSLDPKKPGLGIGNKVAALVIRFHSPVANANWNGSGVVDK